MDKIEKSFAEALKAHIDKKPYGYTTKLAAELGVGQSTVSNWARGARKSTESQRRKVAQKIGIPYEVMIGLKERSSDKAEDHPVTIYTRNSVEESLPEYNSGNYVGVPFFESGRLAAWSNGAVFDLYEKAASEVIVYLPELGHRSKHKLVAAKVGGNSMEPLIPEGSIVIIDLDDKEFFDNKIFAISITEGGVDTAAIKRVRQFEAAEGFVLWSENPDYPPRFVVEKNWLRLCIGRVIWMWRSFDG